LGRNRIDREISHRKVQWFESKIETTFKTMTTMLTYHDPAPRNRPEISMIGPLWPRWANNGPSFQEKLSHVWYCLQGSILHKVIEPVFRRQVLSWWYQPISS
jgi:hypothetical protein